MPPRMQTASRGIRGFNALDDTMKGPRASFFRNDGRGGLRGRIVGPQSSQNSNERRVGTSFGDTGGDYPEEPTATLEEIVARLRGLTQEFAEFRKQRVYQSNETMGSSFEDSDYQPYREIDRGNVMVTLGDFMKLKLPFFLGTKSTKDPQVFLDEMDKICTALGCSSLQVVELTGFRLTEVVQIWFATLKRCKPPSSAPFTWEEFTQAFMDRFLPESVRDAKTQEFETLMQALGMTVSDYDIQFTQLSRYALYLVQTEKERIKRFIKGLHEPIYKILVSQRFQSYPEVVDAARKLEARRKEVGAERERSKRNRGEGSSKYRDPSRGKDANIVGQQGRRDGNLLRRQKSFADNGRRPLEFKIGTIAYRLALPPDFEGINLVFHVSMLRKYVQDPSHVIQHDTILLEDGLKYQEQPVAILDYQVKRLRSKDIALVKVLW
ncbi:Retrotransposon gag domain - like 10 [Theobroma cacao]|nr:Retrotransposon gag domain - like 10 [Theobroma cacao]